jgi:hypothetical protein
MTLFFGLLFGAIGGVYLAIGRRQHEATWLISGFLLMVYPYVFSNAFVIVLVGVLIAAFPIGRQKGWF